MKKILTLLIILQLSAISGSAQNHDLIGYWHNWNDANAPYIQLDQVDSRYSIIEVSFAVPTSPSDMTMLFVPDMITQAAFIGKVQALQALGKKVILSIGGATTSIDLSTTLNKTAFITSLSAIINTYGFDGIDIDIENGNSILASGTIAAPTNSASINLIDAIKQIMLNYRLSHSKKLWLTMAPETAYLVGGQSAYGGIWGGYLPIIDALRDSLDILQMQLYNSGSMFGIDGGIYTQGTVDFPIAMTEAIIQGFSTTGGFFTGIPANKVAVGLPACMSAAGGGFLDTTAVKSALNYLIGNGVKPGTYTLTQSGGYQTLRGMMTWSINWDATNNCNPSYSYAQNYTGIFSAPSQVRGPIAESSTFAVFPNPGNEFLTVKFSSAEFDPAAVEIYSIQGALLLTELLSTSNPFINIQNLSPGTYLLKLKNQVTRFVKN